MELDVIRKVDPDVAEAIEKELHRQQMQQSQSQTRTAQDILAQSTNQNNAVPQYEQIVMKTMPTNNFINSVEPLQTIEDDYTSNETNNSVSQERQAEI